MRFIRWIVRIFARGRLCRFETGYSPTAGVVFLTFRDSFGLHWDLILPPEEARDFAWKMITAADEAESAVENRHQTR